MNFFDVSPKDRIKIARTARTLTGNIFDQFGRVANTESRIYDVEFVVEVPFWFLKFWRRRRKKIVRVFYDDARVDLPEEDSKQFAEDDAKSHMGKLFDKFTYIATHKAPNE